jgi:hypothetical protein
MEVLSEKKKKIRHDAAYAWLACAKHMMNIPPEIALIIAKYVWSEFDNEIAVMCFFHVNTIALSVYDIETDSSRLWEPALTPYIIIEHIIYHFDKAFIIPFQFKAIRRRMVDQVELDRLIANGVQIHECDYIDTPTEQVVQKKQKK